MKPADIEGAITDLYKNTLGVGSSTKLPRPIPDKYIRVRRLGGARLNLIEEQPLILVECWGTTDTEAFDLSTDAWAALDAVEGDETFPIWIGDLALGLPQAVYDAESKRDRYQFTATVVNSMEM